MTNAQIKAKVREVFRLMMSIRSVEELGSCYDYEKQEFVAINSSDSFQKMKDNCEDKLRLLIARVGYGGLDRAFENSAPTCNPASYGGD